MNSKNVCALICAYNEEKTIEKIIKRTSKYVAQVYVVDDGSKDKTYEKAIKAKAVVIRHKKNRGKGAALKTGFSYLKNKNYKAVITLDADGQHLPEEIPKFINKLNSGFDVVIGRRNFNHKSVPLVRSLSNPLYSLALSLINSKEIHDPENGYRAFKIKVLPSLIISSNKGFSYEAEVLIKLLQSKLKIGWVDIKTIYIPGRKSKIKPIRHTIDSIKICARCIKNRF